MILEQIPLDSNLSVLGGISGSEIIVPFYHHVHGAILVKRHGANTLLLLSAFHIGKGDDAIPCTSQRCIMDRLVRYIIQRISASHLAFTATSEGAHNQRTHIDADRYPASRKLVALLQMHTRDSLVQQILDVEAFGSANLEAGSQLVTIHLPVAEGSVRLSEETAR